MCGRYVTLDEAAMERCQLDITGMLMRGAQLKERFPYWLLSRGNRRGAKTLSDGSAAISLPGFRILQASP